MFQYDNDFTYDEYRYEADARELAARDADRRDMEETPAPEDVIMMEDPAAKYYLAIGGVFADNAGPVGMVIDKPSKRKKRVAA